MHPLRRKKIISIMSVLLTLGLVVGLVLYALRQNISLFYTPSDLAAGRAPRHHVIRLGGMVMEGSLVHDHNLDVQFQITDYHEAITVVYHGILPDLFREGKGVVTQGEWRDDNLFQAKTVLAKHDENYMPPEVNDALARSKARQTPVTTNKVGT